MGAPPPPDALPLKEQIALGIGVPPPAPPLPSKPLVSAQASIGGSVGFVPPDAPNLPTQIAAGVAASFQPIIPGIAGRILALCGFKLPGFSFSLSFVLPLPFPIDLSFLFSFALKLSCDGISVDIAAKAGFGGGRVAATVPELDAAFLVS
jgi:hypothetical protein